MTFFDFKDLTSQIRNMEHDTMGSKIKWSENKTITFTKDYPDTGIIHMGGSRGGGGAGPPWNCQFISFFHVEIFRQSPSGNLDPPPPRDNFLDPRMIQYDYDGPAINFNLFPNLRNCTPEPCLCKLYDEEHETPKIYIY